MVPMPRLTFRVARRRAPRRVATCLASSGVVISGPVAISISGMPRRSRRYVTSDPSSDIFLAASSSRHIEDIVIRLPATSMWPPVAMRAVRWNPQVLEPSITIFLMKCISSTGVAANSRDISREASIASLLAS